MKPLGAVDIWDTQVTLTSAIFANQDDDDTGNTNRTHFY